MSAKQVLSEFLMPITEKAAAAIVRTIETHTRPKGQARFALVCVILLFMLFVTRALWFSGLGKGALPRPLVDFDVFHIVARSVWTGDVGKAYHFLHMSQMQAAVAGDASFMPWTYPPQFDLLLAPFGLLPLGLAYALFVGGTMAIYLITLSRLAGAHFPSVLVLFFPSFAITIACGQNGFLLGSLVGLACLWFCDKPLRCGAALGLMVLKPHLALAISMRVIMGKRWRTLAVAAAVVITSSLLCVAALGTEIIEAFVHGAREAGVFLEQGFYPLHRMVSVYAMLRSAGTPAFAAFAAQAAMALLAFGVLYNSTVRAMPMRACLGLACMASVQFSPYAYDYDLPIVGMGMALILPDLIERATMRERAAVYIMSIFMGLFGLAQMARDVGANSSLSTATLGEESRLSIAGLVLMLLLVSCWSILRRSCAGAPDHVATKHMPQVAAAQEL
jgi:hypothetical protein